MDGAIFGTSLGKIAGRAERGVTRIARLRYAKAPTGARRFALPEPVGAWEGTLDATGPSPVPPQLPSRLAKVMGAYPAEQSEDCLHLDIWTPEGGEGPLPVIVFLHGGAFMTGGGGMSCYDGAAMAARQKAVVVNVSYRLGILGFLPLPGLAPANLGLHDQIAALRFIRREIAAFGGDARNVTVIGQSAGAYAIAALLAASRPNELFDKATAISTPLGIPLDRLEETRPRAEDFLARLGVAPGDRAALAEVPVARILDAQGEILRASIDPRMPDNTNPPFRPVVDGDLLAEDPAQMLARDPAAWCPLILGITREEHAAFFYQNPAVAAIADGALEARFEMVFPGRGAAALAAARRRRPGASAVELLGDANSEWRFIRPSAQFAARHGAAGGQVHVYSFDWQSPHRDIAACHCIELPFLFGNPEDWEAPMLAGAREAELRDLSAVFQDALCAFARSGDPAAGLQLDWPAYGPTGLVMHFDRVVRCDGRLPLLA